MPFTTDSAVFVTMVYMVTLTFTTLRLESTTKSDIELIEATLAELNTDQISSSRVTEGPDVPNSHDDLMAFNGLPCLSQFATARASGLEAASSTPSSNIAQAGSTLSEGIKIDICTY